MHGKTNNLKFTVMKKILLIALVSFFVLPAFSQKDSLYVDGMKWVTHYVTFGSHDKIIKISKNPSTYFINGDSIINGIKYKKMYWSVNDYLWDIYPVRYEDGKYLFYLPQYKNDYWGVQNHFIGDDYVLFVEKYDTLVGWGTGWNVGEIGDTVFQDSFDKKRKYWRLDINGYYHLYQKVLNNIYWVEGIGQLIQPAPEFILEVDCPCYNMLTYCINPEGDTIYRNNKYIDYLTSIASVPEYEISVVSTADGLSVNIGADILQWSATLYNSNGVCVAQKEGAGSEIFLPTDSKGTHILVVKAGDRVVKKKIALK